MKELERKYRKDQLSVEELRLLRAHVNAMSDQDIEKEMYEVWMDGLMLRSMCRPRR